jgi:hypothetical protein
MVEKLGIMSDRSIGVLAGNTGIGGINEDVFNEAAFSATGIIIREPLFLHAVSNHLTRIKRTASL